MSHVKRRAKYANNGDAHRVTSRFYAGVKRIALNHGVVTVLLGPNDLSNNRRRLQHVVNSRHFVARAEIHRKLGPRVIVRKAQLDLSARGGVTV